MTARWTVPLATLAGLVVGALAMLWWQAGSVASPGRARTEAIVRDYILSHPDLIPEAMDRLHDRETGQVVAANRAAITSPYRSAMAGNPHGDVTLVEYYDYNCGFCRASLPMIDRLIAADPQLRVVYRELPVLAPTSRDAALASLAAADQGRFAAFHRALYAAGPVTPDSIRQVAAQTGVDLSHADSPAHAAEIAANLRMAGQLGVTGTPSWVIGDRVLSGALPPEQLTDAIRTARAG